MEQNPFPEQRKEREEGRQAPEPQPEPGGTSKSWWNRTHFLRKERREKKGDKHGNPSRNQEEPGNPWWNRTPFLRKERREKKGDKHRNPSRNQEEPAQIMMEQTPFPVERKKRERTSKSWWNKTPFLRKERREKKGDKHRNPTQNQESKSWWNRTPFLRKERREKKGGKRRNPSRNQEEPANHDGREPLSWGNYTSIDSIDPKQQQRMFPARWCAIQNSWYCLARSCPVFCFTPSVLQPYKYEAIKETPRRIQESTQKKGEKKGRRETSTGTPARSRRNQRWIHDGTEPLSWGKKEERRRETSTGTPAGTRRNQQITMEQNRFPEERKKREEGRQAPESKKREEGETSTGSPAGTKRNQQIMMEQNPFPEGRKKREEGRQAPEPQPEPRGTSKSWWNKTLFLWKERRERTSKSWWNRAPFLRKERREKKGDKHRNPSWNQEEPANNDGTEPPSWGKKEERRRETSTGTPAGTRRNQQIMMEQNPFPFPEERKKREEGRQAPEPKEREEGETSTGTPAWTKRNQQIMMEQKEPLSWGKKEERRREASTGTKEERRRETSTGTKEERRRGVHPTPWQCTLSHACHAKAAETKGHRRDAGGTPGRASHPWKCTLSHACHTKAAETKGHRRDAGGTPGRTSDPLAVHIVPRLPRKRGGDQGTPEGRQGVHPAPWQCTLSHACHAKAAETKGHRRDAGGMPGRTSGPLAVHIAPRLPRKRGGDQGTPEGRQGVHPTPWQCTLSHACHAKAAETKGHWRDAGGTPGRTSGPLAVHIVPRLPRKRGGDQARDTGGTQAGPLGSAHCPTPATQKRRGPRDTGGTPEGRQGVHPAPWQCALSHACHAKAAETKGHRTKWVNVSEWVSVREWGSEGVSEWMSEWMSEWVSECVCVCGSVSEWVGQCVSEWVSEWVSESVSQCMFEWVSDWVSAWVNEWVSECVSEWASVSEWVSERTGGGGGRRIQN